MFLTNELKAFNGRFFQIDNTEIMYTVYLSEILYKTEVQIRSVKDPYLELLPSCPLCLEKLDNSVSGLQATILYE